MRVLPPRSWQLLLLFVSATIFVISNLDATAAMSLVSRSKPPTSEAERRAVAREKTRQFLSDVTNRQRPVQALISFHKGLKLPIALAQLKQLAPHATPLVVTSYVFDDMGDRHTFGVLIRPGENPEAKVGQYVRGLAQETRDRATALLRCSGQQQANDQQPKAVQSSEDCPAPPEEARPSLIAQSKLNAEKALVAGVVVEATAETVERLLSDTNTVAAIEIVPDGRIFVSPITPTEGDN